MMDSSRKPISSCEGSDPLHAPGPRPSERRIIDALLRVANFMSEVTDLKRLLTLIMQESEIVMDSEASSCMLYDEDADELYFEVALGEKGEAVKSVRVKRGVGFAGICLAENRTIVVNDVASDARHFSKADETSQFTTRNLIAVPMICQGRMIGVLEVLNKRNGRDYDETDQKIMEILSDQAAMALVNAMLVENSIQAERLAAIGLAVSGIAHHLKNIVVSLKGPIGLLRMALGRGNMQMIENALPIMERGTDRMEHSIGEMLAYSKTREPELEPGDLNELAREVAEECRDRAAQEGVLLRETPDERIGPSWIDKTRLHDALLNLVGNAVDALADCDREQPVVEVRTELSANDRVVRVTVEDNGPGMPEDVQRKIFTPFFSTKGSRGTGLGLAVARKVAEENGGSLTVESAVGKGTSFILSLPMIVERHEKPAFQNDAEEPAP